MRFSTGYGPRPAGGGFETFSWYFMRITAIGLIFLVIIHLFINHVTTDVACTSYQLVAGRYANPYWRVFEWVLLSPALFLGMKWLRVGRFGIIQKHDSRIPRTTLLALKCAAPLLVGALQSAPFLP